MGQDLQEGVFRLGGRTALIGAYLGYTYLLFSFLTKGSFL